MNQHYSERSKKMADKPVTREEKYLAYLTGDYTGELPKPITRKEKYLYELCLKGIGGEISPEEIKAAVNEYLEKNPVKPGATTEQAQQIEQNKADVASLKEDIGNLSSSKISKFYATNNGENHLADSDDGKIADMVLYGKSEQKQYKGINLLPPDTNFNEYVEVSIPKGSLVFWATDGIPANGGNFRFFNENKTENMWFGVDSGVISNRVSLTIDAKYVQNLINADFDLSKICLGVGSNPIYEPYTGGQPSPSPDYPQEIKSVVNPTVKVCGKNLLNATLQTTTRNGVTCTANGDGTYTLNGTTTTTTVFDIAQDVSCSSFRLVGCPVGGVHDASYELQARTNNLIYGYDTGDGKNIKADENFFIRIKINTGINCNNLLFKPMIVDASLYPDATYDDFEPYKEQTVTLPYALNAIPVNSGGNVTIDGQQYVADYVDVERGKLVRMTELIEYDGTENWSLQSINNNGIANFQITATRYIGSIGMCDTFQLQKTLIGDTNTEGFMINNNNSLFIRINTARGISTLETFKEFLANKHIFILYTLSTPTEIDLAKEEITAFKALATYYPTTNISVNSEQLDGYTVFNYPISMQNGWNYVKQQLNDNRDYIYDMDFQSAEAYVNSEYAVALTELEV
jgi:hypothetical protein